MPVFRPRTRLVNFRLSEDEYQLLKDTCARSGARSVSDYARAAVLAGAPAATPVSELGAFRSEVGCQTRWERLEDTVQHIDEKINRLSSVFDRLQPSSPEVNKENFSIHG